MTMAASDTSESDWKVAREKGIRLLDDGEYKLAFEALTKAPAGDASGECHALLGLACFQLQDYTRAAYYYGQALALCPRNEDWRDMANKANANATAEISIPVPAIYYFDRNKLMTPAAPLTRPLPIPPKPRRKLLVERVRQWIGDTCGSIITLIVDLATSVWGAVVSYRDRGVDKLVSPVVDPGNSHAGVYA